MIYSWYEMDNTLYDMIIGDLYVYMNTLYDMDNIIIRLIPHKDIGTYIHIDDIWLYIANDDNDGNRNCDVRPA